jgi:hypothetical protein
LVCGRATRHGRLLEREGERERERERMRGTHARSGCADRPARLWFYRPKERLFACGRPTRREGLSFSGERERERERARESDAHSFTLGARTAGHPPGVLNATRCCSLSLSLSLGRGERERVRTGRVCTLSSAACARLRTDGHPHGISLRFTSRDSKSLRAAERRRRAVFGGEHMRSQSLTRVK